MTERASTFMGSNTARGPDIRRLHAEDDFSDEVKEVLALLRSEQPVPEEDDPNGWFHQIRDHLMRTPAERMEWWVGFADGALHYQNRLRGRRHVTFDPVRLLRSYTAAEKPMSGSRRSPLSRSAGPDSPLVAPRRLRVHQHRQFPSPRTPCNMTPHTDNSSPTPRSREASTMSTDRYHEKNVRAEVYFYPPDSHPPAVIADTSTTVLIATTPPARRYWPLPETALPAETGQESE